MAMGTWLRGFKDGEGDEFTLDLGFHLLREETAEIGGDVLRPRAHGELRDVGTEDFIGDGAGFGRKFPGVPEIE
jgi:hypothetical protein